jgi:hypothetical protein
VGAVALGPLVASSLECRRVEDPGGLLAAKLRSCVRTRAVGHRCNVRNAIETVNSMVVVLLTLPGQERTSTLATLISTNRKPAWVSGARAQT